MSSTKAVLLKYRRLQQDQENFVVEEVANPTSGGSQLVLQVICFSLDPIMYVWMSGAETYYPALKIGDVMHCFGLARVLQSRVEGYTPGDLVFGNTGCSEKVYVDKTRLKSLSPIPKELIEGFKPSQFVYLMNNGLAAFGGIDVMTGLKTGDTVVVSTAAGATGLIVLQLLQSRRVNVIGLTSKNKMEFIEKYCTKVVDYKDLQTLEKVLKETKFKYYFDNVGEWLLDLAIKYIQPYGVLSLCGATSNYLDHKHRQGLKNYSAVISKRLTLRGFNFGMYLPQVFEIMQHFRKMKNDGQLSLKIDTTSMDKISVQFKRLMRGDTIGKIIVQVEEEPVAKL